ncbi:DUF348 domain-containing protein [Nocardioides sp. W3-2-3]|uniref:ubiquitin-like domain-containing protein n=1 Tax=Nocardioides convexus TaxID=2712224 RepID=UPI0024183A4E|nr:ubiquitin-like domain-containing protein [Nocardioides convexus]NHA00547.1 DUF348 domain-containing protein [Nocardioides convexus]
MRTFPSPSPSGEPSRRLIQSRIALVATVAGVLLAVSAVTFGYSSLTTEVTLTVDGKDRTVSTMGDTVQDVLDAEGIKVSARDVLQPGPDEKIEGGDHISVRYSRPVEPDRRRQGEHPLGDRDRRRRRAHPDRRPVRRQPALHEPQRGHRPRRRLDRGDHAQDADLPVGWPQADHPDRARPDRAGRARPGSASRSTPWTRCARRGPPP